MRLYRHRWYLTMGEPASGRVVLWMQIGVDSKVLPTSMLVVHWTWYQGRQGHTYLGKGFGRQGRMAIGGWEIEGCNDRARGVGMIWLGMDGDDRVGHSKSWLRVGMRVVVGRCTGWRMRQGVNW